MDKTREGLVSRRSALRLAGGAALAGTMGLDATARAEPSSAVGDFRGTWHGTYNGRPATLVTAVADDLRVTCTLLDHTTAETYVGHAHAAGAELTGVTLRGHRGELSWRSLRSHRWHHDSASGISWWTEDDPFFGLSLYRDPEGPAVAWHSGVDAAPRTSFGVFDGTGDRFLLHLDREVSPRA